jgi:hypothetical protein
MAQLTLPSFFYMSRPTACVCNFPIIKKKKNSFLFSFEVQMVLFSWFEYGHVLCFCPFLLMHLLTKENVDCTLQSEISGFIAHVILSSFILHELQ